MAVNCIWLRPSNASFPTYCIEQQHLVGNRTIRTAYQDLRTCLNAGAGNTLSLTARNVYTSKTVKFLMDSGTFADNYVIEMEYCEDESNEPTGS